MCCASFMNISTFEFRNMKSHIGHLRCRVCSVDYAQSGISRLFQAVDLYSDWLDECVAANSPSKTYNTYEEEEDRRSVASEDYPNVLQNEEAEFKNEDDLFYDQAESGDDGREEEDAQSITNEEEDLVEEKMEEEIEQVEEQNNSTKIRRRLRKEVSDGEEAESSNALGQLDVPSEDISDQEVDVTAAKSMEPSIEERSSKRQRLD